VRNCLRDIYDVYTDSKVGYNVRTSLKSIYDVAS